MQYKRNPDVEAAPMMDETIIYQPTIKKFCVLNSTAAFLWEQLSKPSSADELAAALCTQFQDIALSDAERDVEAALGEFRALELVVAEA